MSAAQTAIHEERFGDAIDKLTSALSTEGDVAAFVERIEGQFCHCHTKVRTVVMATPRLLLLWYS